MTVSRYFEIPFDGSSSYQKQMYESSLAPASGMTPTGFYVREGETFIVDVKNSDHLTLNFGRHGTPQTSLSIGNGVNEITAPRDGQLFFVNTSAENEAIAELHMPDSVIHVPTFRLGSTTDEEFFQQVEDNPDSPEILILTEHTTTALHKESFFQRNVYTGERPMTDSPEFWADKIEHDWVTEMELAGLDPNASEGAVNAMPTTPQNFVDIQSGYMYAINGTTAISAGPRALSRLFFPDDIENPGSGTGSHGPWHEMGHHLQQFLNGFGFTNESIPNLYANHVRFTYGYNYSIGGSSNDGTPYVVYNRYPDWDSFTDTDLTSSLHMYMQLYNAFGPGFYQRLHHEFRLFANADMPGGTAGELNNFYLKSSEASGYDLTAFFDAWKFPITDETRDAVAALNLPKPTVDLAAVPLRGISGGETLYLYDELQPYEGIPDAGGKSNFIVAQGSTLSPEDLIEYDPSEIAKIEFLNPERDPTAGVGEVHVEVLITGYNGQQNVVVVQGVVTPESWGPNPTPQTIYDQAEAYLNSGAIQSGDISQFANFRTWLVRSGHPESGELLQDLYGALNETYPAEQDAYFESINGYNTTLFYGRPALEVDASQWDDMIASREVVVRFYDAEGKELGEIRDMTENSGLLKYVPYNSSSNTYRIYYDNPDYAGEPIKYQISHKNALGKWITREFTVDGDNIGKATNTDANWADDQFRSDMVEMDADGNVIFTLTGNAYDTMKAAGNYALHVFKNDVEIGRLTIPNQVGVQVYRDGDFVRIKVPDPDLGPMDQIRLEGSFISRSDETLTGPIELSVQGYEIGMPLDLTTESDTSATGTAKSNTFDLSDAAQTVIAGSGVDEVHGNGGDDIIYGGEGNDRLYGGDGNDLIVENDVGSAAPMVNLDFSLDNADGLAFTQINSINEIPGWEVRLGKEASVYTINENGSTSLILDSNTTATGYDGWATVLQSTNYAYEPDADYNFVVNVVGQGIPMDDSIVIAQLLARQDDGTFVVVGDTRQTIPSTVDNNGVEYSISVTHNIPNTAVQGKELYVLIQGRATTEDSAPIEISGVTFTTDSDHAFLSRNDLIDGGDGDDILMAGSGADTVTGGTGNDQLYGGTGNDKLDGGAGNDQIYHGTGTDVIYGGDGNDKIFLGNLDSAQGGAGSDYFTLTSEDAPVTSATSFRTLAAPAATTTTVDGGTDANPANDYDTLELTNVASVEMVSQTLDADGNSYSGTMNVVFNDGTRTVVNYSEIENLMVPCFVRGTMIETATGVRPVETLKKGDMIRTKDRGLQPIRWIASKTLAKPELDAKKALFPVRIPAGALGAGLPKRDLYLSPQHRMLLASRVALRLAGQREVLVAAKDLLVIDGVEYVTEIDEVEYFHFMFDDHAIVFAESAEAESFYAGPEAIRGVDDAARSELLEIFPGLEAVLEDETVPMPAREIVHSKLAQKILKRHVKNLLQ